MPWRSALNAKTKMVERMTDTKGAPADTQNNFGFFMLYSTSKPKPIPNQNYLNYIKVVNSKITSYSYTLRNNL